MSVMGVSVIHAASECGDERKLLFHGIESHYLLELRRCRAATAFTRHASCSGGEEGANNKLFMHFFCLIYVWLSTYRGTVLFIANMDSLYLPCLVERISFDFLPLNYTVCNSYFCH